MVLLFAGDTFYPYGGINDLIGTYSTDNDAITAARQVIAGKKADWAHAFNVETRVTYTFDDRGERIFKGNQNG